MTAWWNNLTALQQVLACFALPATALLLIQTLLLLFGLGGGGQGEGQDMSLFAESVDLDGDGIPDLDLNGDGIPDALEGEDVQPHHGAGVRLFTLRGLVAFFAVGGWLGISMIDAGLSEAGACAVAALGGLIGMALIALVVKWSLSLQENGALDIRNALARTGTVYLTVPAKRGGRGKITLTVQGKFTELDAVTDSPEPLRTETPVQVIGVVGESTVLVRPLTETTF